MFNVYYYLLSILIPILLLIFLKKNSEKIKKIQYLRLLGYWEELYTKDLKEFCIKYKILFCSNKYTSYYWRMYIYYIRIEILFIISIQIINFIFDEDKKYYYIISIYILIIMILITYFNQPFQNLEKREEIKRKIAIENDDYDLSAALCLNKKNGLNPIDVNKYLELQLSFKFPTNHNVYLIIIRIFILYIM